MTNWASIYEFIQRRSDWKKIEKTVDNVSVNQAPVLTARQCTRCLSRRTVLSCRRHAMHVAAFTISCLRYSLP